MNIENNIVDQNWGEALVALKGKLNGYMRCWGRIYVGTTTDYSARARKHAPNGWEKMVLLYNAYGPGLAAGMETKLIAHVHTTEFRVVKENVGRGGEGVLPDNSHFIYVLVGERRGTRIVWARRGR
ncbi:MAG: hypothetical protein Q8P41_12980 [Pseudomonadota bacterium]|nr:hypothetical protein [Pseudomonadota bacterium]